MSRDDSWTAKRSGSLNEKDSVIDFAALLCCWRFHVLKRRYHIINSEPSLNHRMPAMQLMMTLHEPPKSNFTSNFQNANTSPSYSVAGRFRLGADTCTAHTGAACKMPCCIRPSWVCAWGLTTRWVWLVIHRSSVHVSTFYLLMNYVWD